MEPTYYTFLELLLAYGFSEDLSKQALEAVGVTTFEALLDWIAITGTRTN